MAFSKKTQLIEQHKNVLKELLALKEVLKIHLDMTEITVASTQKALLDNPTEEEKRLLNAALQNYTDLAAFIMREDDDTRTCINFTKKFINDALES